MLEKPEPSLIGQTKMDWLEGEGDKRRDKQEQRGGQVGILKT